MDPLAMDLDEIDMVAIMAENEERIVERLAAAANPFANLPVAVPVRIIQEHRRRRMLLRMRGFRNNNINQENDDQPPWMQQHPPQAAEAVVEPVTSFLTDLIAEDLPCSGVLSGSQIRGCSCIVERIQEHPGEVQYQCPRTGRSPLHESAVRGGCRHVMEALLQADPSRALQLDARSNTPLHLLFMGITSRNEDVVEILLQPIANWVGTLRNREGCLPLHCACSAPLVASPDTIELLLEAAPSSAARTNHQEQTPLHLHCMRRGSSVEIARLLVNACPESLSVRDRAPGAGFTPLHYAAQQANHPLISLLAQADHVAAATTSVSSSQTALHLLCQQNPNTEEDIQSIQVLLQVAPGSATRREQTTLYTPLHLLCRGTRAIDVRAVQAVVDAAPAALSMRDVAECVPLHYACENGAHADVIRCLLTACPNAAAIRTRKNDTALTLACAANHSVESVQLLLQANPSAALHANDYGFLPLHCVCRAYQANTAIVQALVKACPEAVLKTTHAGESVLHLTSNNPGASIGILDLLQRTVKEQQGTAAAETLSPAPRPRASPRDTSWSRTSVGNTPRT